MIALILLGIMGVNICWFLYDEIVHNGFERKKWQEDRVLKKITEDDEQE